MYFTDSYNLFKLTISNLKKLRLHLGGQDLVRTPAVWLTPKVSAPHPRFSTNNNPNVGIDAFGNGLSLNQWYHIGYTLSEPEKRLDFYMDGHLVRFQSVQDVQADHVTFNNGPLYIGNDIFYNGITGQIRYYS